MILVILDDGNPQPMARGVGIHPNHPVRFEFPHEAIDLMIVRFPILRKVGESGGELTSLAGNPLP